MIMLTRFAPRFTPIMKLARMALALSLIAACTCTLHATPPSDAEVLSKVDAIAAGYLKRPEAVGVSIGVARKGQVIVAKAYGLADVELDVSANKDTMFRIGSITKQ